jgi:hypothetical protein
MHTKCSHENFMERAHLGDLGVNGKTCSLLDQKASFENANKFELA